MSLNYAAYNIHYNYFDVTAFDRYILQIECEKVLYKLFNPTDCIKNPPDFFQRTFPNICTII